MVAMDAILVARYEMVTHFRVLIGGDPKWVTKVSHHYFNLIILNLYTHF